MKCPVCQFDNRPEARFCKQCGAVLSPSPASPGVTCPACGASVRAGARFCPRCGGALPAQPEQLQPSAAPAAPRQPAVESAVRGDIRIGDKSLAIGEVKDGGVVNVTMAREGAQARRSPVYQRPRPFEGLLDREEETRQAAAAFPKLKPVEYHGEGGIGKTALLRHLAYSADPRLFADGIVYLPVRGTALADLLLGLFDIFYEREGGWKPTEAEVRRGLAGKRALVLLDDVELARDDVEALLNAAPGCAFVLASTERRLWGGGVSLDMGGLPPAAAQALLERELGRSLTAEEREQARRLCAALHGHPLRILQAAAEVRQARRPLADVAARPQLVTAEVLNSLPPAERRVLAALVALGGVPLSADHVAGMTGMAAVLPELERLERRGLVQQHSPTYSPAGGLVASLGSDWAGELEDIREGALVYFAQWAAQQQEAETLAASAEAIMAALSWGVKAGRWRQVWQLGHLLEGALALSGRWAAWEQVLGWMLGAARALGEQGLEGWALHQLGTRALCLGDKTAARAALTKALRLREMLGDEPGAAVTRHNLNLLLAPPPPPRPPGKPPAARPRLPRWVLPVVGGGATLLLAGAAVLGAVLLSRVIAPPLPVEPSPTFTPTVRPVQPGAPWVRVSLGGGCNRTYRSGQAVGITVESNVGGVAVVRVDGETVNELSLVAGYPSSFNWPLDLGAGAYTLEAVLYGAQGEQVASARCVFSIEEEVLLPQPLEPAGAVSLPCLDGYADVTLRWSAAQLPLGVSGYRVYGEVENPLTTPPLPFQVDTDDTTVVQRLACGWNYRWRVQAIDGTGEASEWSDWLSFRLESGGLDAEIDPAYGSEYLATFCPSSERVAVEMRASGSIDLAYLGEGCRGYAARGPALQVDWQGNADRLDIFFEGNGDTTLAVRGPDDSWYCDDDSYGNLNPQLTFFGAPRGQYTIWVGVYSSGDAVGGVLIFEPGCIDTQPPPAPTDLTAANPDSAYAPRLPSCSTVILQWGGVDDVSGIQDYVVELEQRDMYSDWGAAPKSLERVDELTREVSGLSSWYEYRWRVAAIDGAGNQGPFSVWYYFSCVY